MDSTATRRSSRAVKPVEKAKAAPVVKKTTKKAVGAPKKTKDTPSGTVTADGVVKRKVGRPLGSTKTKKAPVSASTKPKGPERRGRKPKAATLLARAAAAAAAATAGATGNGLKVEEQVSKLDVGPKKSNAGRKRKVEEISSDNVSAKRKAVVKDEAEADTPVKGKRGRPVGSGKKQAVKAEATATTTGTESVSKDVAKDDSEGDYSGIKLTIERCTTCTQYRKNVKRIFEVTKNLYPHALLHEEVVPNSKSFEIYLSVDGSKNKLIWSGKAHAPPKRLAFPDTDVFVGLLNDEFRSK
ncbi:hypothetical protein EMPS_10402 [Entomortierella parvispora]|uniref:Selenoprotein H n=1 Tax=Entomortierella parvispora TaxID=205924 RepID=A0A9P3HK85_9FUNG|nr:hypothetical protein EMPS_10402 [Entomortierella parvispora]